MTGAEEFELSELRETGEIETKEEAMQLAEFLKQEKASSEASAKGKMDVDD